MIPCALNRRFRRNFLARNLYAEALVKDVWPLSQVAHALNYLHVALL
jgi:hypothetical protein